MNHIDHEAELYALGMLDDAERARIDEHIATCAACLQRVGTAEEALTALVDASQERPRQRRAARWPLAVAAAFALAAAGALGQNLLLRGELASDGTVLATLVNSHFDHTQFQTLQGQPVGAKAVYERHGKWYEILADGEPDWRVVLVQADGTRDLAPERFARRGSSSVLTVRPDMPAHTIELQDAAGHVVGIVHPALEPDTR